MSCPFPPSPPKMIWSRGRKAGRQGLRRVNGESGREKEDPQQWHWESWGVPQTATRGSHWPRTLPVAQHVLVKELVNNWFEPNEPKNWACLLRFSCKYQADCNSFSKKPSFPFPEEQWQHGLSYLLQQFFWTPSTAHFSRWLPLKTCFTTNNKAISLIMWLLAAFRISGISLPANRVNCFSFPDAPTYGQHGDLW